MAPRENSIDILADTIAPYDMKDNNKLKTIVVFDCRWKQLVMQWLVATSSLLPPAVAPRGLEPVDFSPRNGWKVE